ncbi:MAG: hypothetical protein HY719_06875, partial [Planctomycetes bacterium]|nr:hypothetical protein [Planctomycetota bacterium]
MDVPLIRSAEFSDVISRWAYMNHANVAPRPRRVAEAEIRQIHGVRDNGVADAPEWTKCYDDCRALAARLINATPGEIA